MVSPYLDDCDLEDDEEDAEAEEHLMRCRQAASQIGKLLSDAYLFEHRPWLQRVRALTESHGGVPLSVLVQSGFEELQWGDKLATAELLAEALRKCPSMHEENDALPELALSEQKGEQCVRRVRAVDMGKDPDLRTIFAIPMPFKASDRDVTAFFERWGEVERLTRREWTDTDDKRRRKPGVLVTFSDPSSARNCVEAKPSFTVACDLGGLFVPRLVVQMKRPTEQIRSDTSQSAAGPFQGACRDGIERPMQKNDFVVVQKTAAPAQAGLSPLARQFLLPGHVLRVTDLPSGAQWRDVRQFIQKDLQLNTGRKKNLIAYTHFEAEERRAFVIMKTEAAVAQAMAKLKNKQVMLQGAVPVIAVADEADCARLSGTPSAAGAARTGDEAGLETPAAKRPHS